MLSPGSPSNPLRTHSPTSRHLRRFTAHHPHFTLSQLANFLLLTPRGKKSLRLG